MITAFILLLLICVIVTISWRMRKKKTQEILLSIYLSLCELYGYHYWMVSLPYTQDNPELKQKVNTLLLMTCDNLRHIRYLKIARQIQEALAWGNHEATADAAYRYRTLASLLESLKNYILDYYPQAAQQLKHRNQAAQKALDPEADDTLDILNPASYIDWKPKRDGSRRM